jgi:hypothetical protein
MSRFFTLIQRNRSMAAMRRGFKLAAVKLCGKSRGKPRYELSQPERRTKATMNTIRKLVVHLSSARASLKKDPRLFGRQI